MCNGLYKECARIKDNFRACFVDDHFEFDVVMYIMAMTQMFEVSAS